VDALLKFLRRISTFLVFFILETVAFLIIVNHGVFQKSVFQNIVLEATSIFYVKISNVTDYFSLKEINEDLAQKNAYLQHRISNLEDFIAEKNYQSAISGDTIVKIIPAKVINQTVDKINNYMIINKGRNDGIKENMGVTNTDGVVGVVQSVSANYAVVISILNSKQKISGRFKKTGYLCSVFWDGNSPYTGSVINIPEHITAAVGDTILTSGYSSIFPEGIMIGTVKKVSLNTSTAWNDLEIKYAIDFMSIRYVNVIVGAYHNELFDIQKNILQ
jgi:rod shape-determining protein MreC